MTIVLYMIPDLRISRSENNPVRAGGANSVECVSMYCVSELLCEGSELSFEELRARRYFAKRSQQEEQRRLGEKTNTLHKHMLGEMCITVNLPPLPCAAVTTVSDQLRSSAGFGKRKRR